MCLIITKFGEIFMEKSCFVIMGFGIKNNINLDLTYNEIIKPCILENNLIPYQLYKERKYNAYRCDEIIGTTSIDYKFITCLSEADIVIADISTMNVNAIYELGARHALKPKTTIILCAKDKEKEFNFFDITYVPILFYKHNGLHLNKKAVKSTKNELNKLLDFAINSNNNLPDNPIQRAMSERKLYHQDMNKPNDSIYSYYLAGCNALTKNDFSQAELHFGKLLDADFSEENLLLLVLAKYKKAELNESPKELIETLALIKNNININNSKSEELFGRIAAINLRLYNLTLNDEYYYAALESYRKGSEFCTFNLYCPRNYCSTLIRIYELTEDKNIIKEYFYTAVHYAKLFLNKQMSVTQSGSYEERIYYRYNVNDLKSITECSYINYESVMNNLESDKEISPMQKKVITTGIAKLRDDLENVNKIIKLF